VNLPDLVRKVLVRSVPFSRTYDRLYSLVHFVPTHRRWPRRYLFNDRLHQIKCDGTLLDPLRQVITDKVDAKEFIRARLGDAHLVGTLAVLSSEKEINDYEFPQRCVIKAAHTSQNVLICRDGIVDKHLLASWLKIDYYRKTREQNYVFLRPRIIVEEFALGSDTVPEDIRIFCVDGAPKGIMVDYDHFTDQTRVIYDIQWNPQPYGLYHPIGRPRPRPGNLEEMLAAATTLSRGFDFIRVDFYSDGTAFKVGEITNCHASGIQKFHPVEGERMFSRMLFGEEE
jgi:TupA-like ATPgrasp